MCSNAIGAAVLRPVENKTQTRGSNNEVIGHWFAVIFGLLSKEITSEDIFI